MIGYSIFKEQPDVSTPAVTTQQEKPLLLKKTEPHASHAQEPKSQTQSHSLNPKPYCRRPPPRYTGTHGSRLCHACAGRHPVRLPAAIDFQTRSGPLPSQGRHRRFLAPYRMPRPRTPARPCHACAGRHPVRLTASTGCWILEAQWGAACGRVGGRLALWGQPAAGNRNPDEHGFTWVVPTQITMFLVGAGSGTIYSLDVLCSIMAISSSVRL